MGNYNSESISFTDDNKIFLDTHMNIELSSMKHEKDKDLLHLYVYGTSEETIRHYLLDIIIDLNYENLSLGYCVRDKSDISNIIPSNHYYKSEFIYASSNSIMYVNPENNSKYLIRDDDNIHKKLFWSQLQENELISIDMKNNLEVIDMNKSSVYENYNKFNNSSLSNIFNYDSTIIDAYMLEKSPYTNCICLSTSDAHLLIFDYKNKCIVDKIQTKKIVNNISFMDLNMTKMSCSEHYSDIIYIYDFKKFDEPLINFRSPKGDETDDINNYVLLKQSWVPNHSKYFMSLNSNSKSIFFNYVDFPNSQIEKNNLLQYESENIHLKDKIILDYFSTENYLMLQYEKEIEILSYSQCLKII